MTILLEALFFFCSFTERRRPVLVNRAINRQIIWVETMFRDQLLAGRRILVTGGGTGLGKSMAARFLELGAEVHICGRRKIVCDETATELMDQYGGRVVSHGVDIRNAHGRRRDDRADLDRRSPHRPHQQCRRQFHLPYRGTESARLRCGRQHRHARHLLRHACGRPALDRQQAARQRGVDHRDLGAQRLALCGALGDEQVGDPRHDHVAGDRMGPLRHPAQHDRARRNPDRRHEQAHQARRRGRRAHQGDEPDGPRRHAWRNCRTSRCS